MKTAAKALVLAAIYPVIGWIALTIAGPKGFATAVFPAAAASPSSPCWDSGTSVAGCLHRRPLKY